MGLKIQSCSFMTIILFFKNFANAFSSEHDEVMLLLVENDRKFSVIVASTSFFFPVIHTLYVYIHSSKPTKLLLFLNRLKSTDLRRRKKYNFSFLQGFIWFKVVSFSLVKFFKSGFEELDSTHPIAFIHMQCFFSPKWVKNFIRVFEQVKNFT